MNPEGGAGVRNIFSVVFNDVSIGLGVKIIGGAGEEEERDYGIHVRRVLPGGLAEQYGLQEGDQLLSVNGESLEHVTNDEAVALLRSGSANNYIELQVARDAFSRSEYQELVDVYGYSTAASDRHSHSSGTSTSSASINRKKSLQRSGGNSPANQPSLPSHVTASSPHSHPQENNTGLYSAHSYLHPSPPDVPNANSVPSSSFLRPTSGPVIASTPQVHKPDGVSKPPPNWSPDQTLAGLSPITNHTSAEQNGHSVTDTGAQVTPEVTGQGSSSLKRGSASKLSLDPHIKIHVERLVLALQYLGLDPTEEQQNRLRDRLEISESTQTITYGEFVSAAKVVFKEQLEQRGILPSAMFMAAHVVTNMPDSSSYTPEMTTVNDSPGGEDLALVMEERDILQQEVDRLKMLLREKEQACNLAEDELLRVRKEAQGAIHEARSLRSKVQLAEQAQRAARDMENDYETVIQLLESELAELRMGINKPVGDSVLQKRLAVMGCQLRKTDASRKTYEVATEKLLHFAEMVNDTLSSKQKEAAASDKEAGPSQTQTPKNTQLASAAKDVIRTVRALLEEDVM